MKRGENWFMEPLVKWDYVFFDGAEGSGLSLEHSPFFDSCPATGVGFLTASILGMDERYQIKYNKLLIARQSVL